MSWIKFMLCTLVFVCVQTSYAESLTRGFAWPLEVRKLDPHNTSSDTIFSLISHYLAPLVEINPNDNSVMPALAEQWSISDGGRTITLQLRKDAYWSDGVQITSQQVKQSIERALSVEMASDAQILLFPIKGARERLAGQKNTPLGIDVLDSHTLSFKLTYRHPDFIRALAFPITAPLPMHQMGADAAYPLVGQLSSSGPYRIIKTEKHSATFIANEKYFGKQPYFKKVRFIFGEYKVLIKHFLDKTYDTLEYIPVDQVSWLKENMPESIRVTSNSGAFYLVFKHEDSGGFSPLLRQLLSESLDYHRLNQVMSGPHFTTISGLIPWGPELPANTAASEKRRHEAVEEARQLMIKNGYSKASPMNVCISLANVSSNESLFNLLQAYLSSMYIQLSEKDSFRNNFISDINLAYDDPKDLCHMLVGGYASRIRSEEEIILAFFPGGLFSPFLVNQSELNHQYVKMNQLEDMGKRKIALHQMKDYLFEQGYVRALYKTGLISLVDHNKIGAYTKIKPFYSIPVTQYLKPLVSP